MWYKEAQAEDKNWTRFKKHEAELQNKQFTSLSIELNKQCFNLKLICSRD